MISTIAQALFDRLIAVFPPDRVYRRSDIRREPMPRALADYLEQVLHMKLRDAVRESHLQEAWIDTQAAEVNEARAHFFNLAARHQGFPASEWADFLKNACCQTLYLVIQPTASLIDSVFDTLGTPVRADTMRERMGFYPARIPYRDALETWLQEQGDEPIDRDSFDAFVCEADRQLAAGSSPEAWLRLLDPLVKVLATAGHREIPVEFIEAFLREKSADALSEYLGKLYGSKESIPVDKLEAFFTSGLAQPPEAVEETRREPETTTEPPTTEPLTTEPTRAPQPRAPQPLWKRFAQRLNNDASAEAPSQPAAPVQNGSESAEPLWKQFRPASAPAPVEEVLETAAVTEQIPVENGAPATLEQDAPATREQDPPVTREQDASATLERVAPPDTSTRIFAFESDSAAPLPEEPAASEASPDVSKASEGLAGLESAVFGERGGRNRGLFVQCLFQGQEDAYEAVLQRLHGARDWSDASQIIAHDVFMKYQVNIYSPPAVTFTEAVEARYGVA